MSRAALQRTGLELPTGESRHITTQLVLAESGESDKSAVAVLTEMMSCLEAAIWLQESPQDSKQICHFVFPSFFAKC